MLPDADAHALRVAIKQLGYEGLDDQADDALAIMEQSKRRLAAGRSAKEVRFELYKAWAGLAGCEWPSRDTRKRFNVHGSDLHVVVKELIPDGAES